MRLLRSVAAAGWILAGCAGGLLLADEMEASEEESSTRPGPSHRLFAPPVALAEHGEWRSVPDREPISALQVSPLLTALDPEGFVGSYFLDAEPTLYPLASEVLVQARQWIWSEGGGPSSGYQQRHNGQRRRRPRLPEQARESRPSGRLCVHSFGARAFGLWASSLIRLVLKSGTSFAHFLSKTLLPAPFPSPVGEMFQRRGGRRRTPVHMKHALRGLELRARGLPPSSP